MINFNDRIPIIVHAKQGNVPIETLTPGDYVYNFFNGMLEEVLDVVELPMDHIFKVTYNDDREDYYRGSELIYVGNDIIRVDNLPLPPKTPFGDISQSLMYREGCIEDINIFADVDPYTAGLFLIHGDRKDEYINLPLDRYQADSFIYGKSNMTYAEKLGDNKVYFMYKDDPDDKIITWEDLFPKINFKSGEIIPPSYMRTSVNDRWQFIRAVFDLGHTQPMNAGMWHDSEETLKAIQEMLWSLGMLSKVKYDPSMVNSGYGEYRLDILPLFSTYPGSFYDVDFIIDMVNKKGSKRFKLQIKNITYEGKGYSSNLLLRKPKCVYIANKFLPRVAI